MSTVKACDEVGSVDVVVRYPHVVPGIVTLPFDKVLYPIPPDPTVENFFDLVFFFSAH
jgi:hypothetical protein